MIRSMSIKDTIHIAIGLVLAIEELQSQNIFKLFMEYFVSDD